MIFSRLIRLPIWALGLVSLVLGLSLSFFANSVEQGNLPWISLGMPLEKPVRIVAANHDSILIESEDGDFYNCIIHEVVTYDDSSCWEEAAAIYVDPSHMFEVFRVSRDKLVWPVQTPKNVIDTLSIGVVNVDAGYWRNHVLTASGEVFYQSEIGWTAYNELGIFLAARGAFFGLLLSVGVLATRALTRKRLLASV